MNQRLQLSLFISLSLLLMTQCSKKGKKSNDGGSPAATTEVSSGGGVQSGAKIPAQDDDNQLSIPVNPPTINMMTLSGFGPSASAGSSTAIQGTAFPNGSSVSLVEVSVRSGNSCLNSNKTAFNAACPNFIAASGTVMWNFAVADSLFADGQSYGFTARASETSGLQAQTSEQTYTWDSVAPSAISGLTIGSGPEELNISWNAASGANYYLVIGNQGTTNAFLPTPGAIYSTGDILTGGYRVAYFGANTSYTEQSLPEFKEQTYAVYAVDNASNMSSVVLGGAIPYAKPKFRGIQSAALNLDDRTITVDWQKFYDGVTSADALTYKVYTAATSGGQNFAAAPAASVVGGQSLRFKDSGSSANLYMVVKAQGPNGNDSNTKEFRINVGSGSHHKIINNGRFNATDPSNVFLQNNWATQTDPYGNVLFSGMLGTLHVYCAENVNAPYCNSRTTGRVYTIAGRDGDGNSTTPAPANETAMGQIYSIALDNSGNIFLADSTYSRIRVICYTPHLNGVCRARNYGYSYIIAGSGTAGDGADGTDATVTNMGVPYGAVVDSNGNLFIADYTYFRVRAVCYNVTAAGFCSGKIAGAHYRFAGTGATADGADNVLASTAAMGSPGALAIDPKNNLYIADATRFRVRIICLDVTAGFCNGKTAGNVYRAVGTGVTGNGADNTAAASNPIGAAFGIALDSSYNIFISDFTNKFIRVVCQENSGSDYCGTGATVGNMYLVIGTGVANDGVDTLALAADIGDPRGIAVDMAGNVYISDNNRRRIRVACQNISATSFCQGKIQGYHYRLTGRGPSLTGNEYNVALNEQFGTTYATATDMNGNIYVADGNARRVLVICANVSNGGFCQGKTKGYMYYYAGNGTAGDGADGYALARSMGTVYGLDTDSKGNVYILDSTYRKVRVVCWDTTGSGPCAGKSAGSMYRTIGSGTAGAGANNAAALTSNLGTLMYDVALDSHDNVYISDDTNKRIFATCYDVVSSGFCSGKTIGNIYYFAGTGAAGDGADNTVATSGAMGTPRTIAFDTNDNMVIGDGSYFRVRAVCYNNASGFCQGKTVGNAYRLAGTGVTGNGANNVLASTAAMGVPYAIAVDSHYNVYVSDFTNPFVRSICYDVVSSGFCSGLTAGNSYRMAGTGTRSDGPSNDTMTAVHFGYARLGGLDFLPSGAMIRTDEYNNLRLLIP